MRDLQYKIATLAKFIQYSSLNIEVHNTVFFLTTVEQCEQ